MKKMTKKSLAVALTGAMCLALVGCGGGEKKETTAETTAETGGETTAAAEGGVDVNALSLEELTEKAKAEGHVESVGMPDEWADWGSLWTAMSETHGLTHNDTDMSSF